MIKSFVQRLACGVPLMLVLATPLALGAQQRVIPVWPGTAPGSENWTYQEVDYLNKRGIKMVRNVVTPTLTVYPANPALANGTAVIFCPGGGFRTLSYQDGGVRCRSMAQRPRSDGFPVEVPAGGHWRDG